MKTIIKNLFSSIMLILVGFQIVMQPFVVFADGGFFVSDTYLDKDLTEPEQKAMLIFNGETEQLIIQAKALGNVPDFAWVIPVPSYPKLSEGDGRLFNDLHRITAPREVSKLAISVSDFLFSIFSTSKGLSGNLNDVILHESTKVGIFDASVLSAKGGTALMLWLQQNNYHIPKETVPVLDEYIAKDWYFVALKVNELNIPLINSLHNIDNRIVSIESANKVISQEVMASVKREENSVDKFL